MAVFVRSLSVCSEINNAKLDRFWSPKEGAILFCSVNINTALSWFSRVHGGGGGGGASGGGGRGGSRRGLLIIIPTVKNIIMSPPMEGT